MRNAARGRALAARALLWVAGVLALAILAFNPPRECDGATWNKLKTCAQSGFCSRHRGLPPRPHNQVTYAVRPESVHVGSSPNDDGAVSGLVSISTVDSGSEAESMSVDLAFQIRAYDNGVMRWTLDEQPGNGRFERYRPTDGVLVDSLRAVRITEDTDLDRSSPLRLRVRCSACKAGLTDPPVLVIDYNPLRVTLESARGAPLVILNGHELLRFERQDEDIIEPPESQQHEEAPTHQANSEHSPEVGGDHEGASHVADGTDHSDEYMAGYYDDVAGNENDFGLDAYTAPYEDYNYGLDDMHAVPYGEDAVPDDIALREFEAPVAPHGSETAHACRGCFQETFDGHTDVKARGPESIGVDIEFPRASHVFGIPERTSSFALQDTKRDGLAQSGESLSDPYRMYNLDVFEYELNSPFGLYGSVPLLMAVTDGGHWSGVFWLNPSETYVDVTGANGTASGGHNGSNTSITTHWFSESGVMDVFLLGGGDMPCIVYNQYVSLTGPAAVPNTFALGFHQSRWKADFEADTRAVDRSFDTHDVPYDVLWLDIEHTDGKRYFTWDLNKYPNPVQLQHDIDARGRKMVTIIDPHVKRDGNYALHRFAEENGLYVKEADGTTDYVGFCWPGSSSYFDFVNPAVRAAWASRFSPEFYKELTPSLYTWVDMNEPSVFNGPEQTMPKGLKHFGGWEHRDVHNLYGLFVQRATFEGLLQARNSTDRPFVLSRAFFAGSQRFGAVWTGDNAASWGHLQASIPMLLSLQISGIVFSGADIGGFFGNPTRPLAVRWYQAAAFQPFFRAHKHIDADPREPWLLGNDNMQHIRKAISERYTFLPYWYTLFAVASTVLDASDARAASKDGMHHPPMRPIWWHFPSERALLGGKEQEHSWMVGDALLVAPVLSENTEAHRVRLPGGGGGDVSKNAPKSANSNSGATASRWFDLYGDYAELSGGETHIYNEVSLDRMFVFQRGGTIVPRKMRRRRSTVAMNLDPLTLVVALDSFETAHGTLYVDDGKSFAYEEGNFVVRSFEFSSNRLTARTVAGSEEWLDDQRTERSRILCEKILVLGLAVEPSTILAETIHRNADGSYVPKTVELERDINFNFYAQSRKLVVRRLPFRAYSGDWTLHLM
ncbi:putative glucan 1,3-alpha-glucosidase [Porphyridium purpureum]|uniref:Glucosidase II subunit alpha n=1 Tax=Porphyridium purpureum TaxID=35688 RepID=A0A5J4YIQ3_PORPP|nr:putative glucan 1,3-alpha-glucosidase [Porphyridium purpureum]|eukprot:POR9306..scf210_14